MSSLTPPPVSAAGTATIRDPATAAAPSQVIAAVDQLPQGIKTYPLHPIDPPKIGDFWPSARLVSTASGVAYLAYEDNATAPVMVILLGQGASEDAGARDRFAGEVDRMDIDTVVARGGLGQDTGRLGNLFRSEDDDPQGVDAVPQSPWVALAFDGSPQAIAEANRVLSQVDLSLHAHQGRPSGPDYRLHWSDRTSPGLTRVWPLPWPGRRERGGRLSILAAWLLMILLAALAILIAILIFSQAPPTSPQSPIGQETTEETDSGDTTDGTPTDGDTDATEDSSGGGPSTPPRI